MKIELQNKFEEIINSTIYFRREDEPGGKLNAAKECAKLCLEEQIKLLSKLSDYQSFSLSNEIEELQQQLKELENEK